MLPDQVVHNSCKIYYRTSFRGSTLSVTSTILPHKYRFLTGCYYEMWKI